MRDNKNKILEVIIVLIILCIVWYFLYPKLMQKSGGETPNPSNQEDNTPIADITISYGETYIVNQKESYKSKDGKNELIIEPKTDDLTSNHVAYFNGKKISAVVFKNGKYLLVEVREENDLEQCDKRDYIVDSENNTIVDLYSNNLFNILKINEKYYFKEYVCLQSAVSVYDENLNKIGSNLLGHDKMYLYVFNGNIVKYNSNGKVVFKSSETYESRKDEYTYETLENETGLYILIVSEGNIYFIDSNDENLKPIKVGTTSEYNYSFGTSDLSIDSTEDNKIYIKLYDKNNQPVKIIYNPTTMKIEK